MNNIFYVYKHRKATTGEVFYIGKGKENRAYSEAKRNFIWNNIVAKHGFEVEIVESDLSENDAFLMERDLVAHYGRRDLRTGTLANLTDGGEGMAGHVFSDDHKANLRKAWEGHTPPCLEQSLAALELARAAAQTPEVKEKRAAHHIGVKRAPSVGRNISKAKKAAFKERKEKIHTVVYPSEIRMARGRERGAMKTSAALKGRGFSDAHREKISIAASKRTGSKNPASRKVRCIELCLVFDTLKEAAVHTEIKVPNSISRAACGLQKQCGGYTWEFAT